jgi:hypothetical protein
MLERRFELYSEHSLLGKLRFEAEETAYGALTIAGSAMKRWGGGWVEFVNGSKFYWKSTCF